MGDAKLLSEKGIVKYHICILLFISLGVVLQLLSSILQESQRNPNALSSFQYYCIAIVFLSLLTLSFGGTFIFGKHICFKSRILTAILILGLIFSIISLIIYLSIAQELLWGTVIIILHFFYSTENVILLLQRGFKTTAKEDKGTVHTS